MRGERESEGLAQGLGRTDDDCVVEPCGNVDAPAPHEIVHGMGHVTVLCVTGG